MAKVDTATALALMDIMPVREVAKIIDMSIAQLNRLKTGDNKISKLDKELIKSLGLKICQCCDERLVPIKPVRHQKLTRLCEKCWSSDFAEEDYEILIKKDLSYDSSMDMTILGTHSFEDEIWKCVDEAKWPKYQVSNYGRVYSFVVNNFMPLKVTMSRNLMVILKTGKIVDSERGYLVAHLVLNAFIGPCPEGHELGRKNTVLSDNQLKNLSWKEKHAA